MFDSVDDVINDVAEKETDDVYAPVDAWHEDEYDVGQEWLHDGSMPCDVVTGEACHEESGHSAGGHGEVDEGDVCDEEGDEPCDEAGVPPWAEAQECDEVGGEMEHVGVCEDV